MRLLNANTEEAMAPVVDNFELDDHLERQTTRLVLGQQQKSCKDATLCIH